MQAASKMYASALMSIGREDGSAPRLYEEILELDRLMRENPELDELLISPAFSSEEKRGVISSLFSGKIDPMLYNTVCLLTEKRRMSLFHEIASDFRASYYEAYGIAEADVTTAVPMNAELREKLKVKLERYFGKKMILNEHIDPHVLGGVRVVCGGEMLDGTLRSRLDSMKDMITDNMTIGR